MPVINEERLNKLNSNVSVEARDRITDLHSTSYSPIPKKELNSKAKSISLRTILRQPISPKSKVYDNWVIINNNNTYNIILYITK